ncbi:MAG: hypothetical protein EBS55_12485 [Flavobacteriaceae bacterium]|nr:hypothetical protein [Flavobacteriaceae bacterium]
MTSKYSLSIFSDNLPDDFDFHLPEIREDLILELVISNVKKIYREQKHYNDFLCKEIELIHNIESTRRIGLVNLTRHLNTMYQDNQKLKSIISDMNTEAHNSLCNIVKLYDSYKFELEHQKRKREDDNRENQQKSKRERKKPEYFIDVL